MSEPNGEWQLIALKADGEPRFYRIRIGPPTGVIASDYSNCVIIEWSFEDALPTKPLIDAHRAFEAHMEPLGDNNPNSVLMHVFTRAGMKEWCYYARDYPAFMTDLNAALAGKPRFPIEILHDEDPEWSYWSQIKEFANSAPGL